MTDTPVEGFTLWDDQADQITAARTAQHTALAMAAVEPLWPYLSAALSEPEFEHRLALSEPNMVQVLGSVGALEHYEAAADGLRSRYTAQMDQVAARQAASALTAALSPREATHGIYSPDGVLLHGKTYDSKDEAEKSLKALHHLKGSWLIPENIEQFKVKPVKKQPGATVNGHPVDISKFVNGPISQIGGLRAGDTVQVMAYPQCDICGAEEAHYDGKTVMGPWAYMGETCWKQYGPGKLGTGYGQKLVLAPSSKTSAKNNGTVYDSPADLPKAGDKVLGRGGKIGDDDEREVTVVSVDGPYGPFLTSAPGGGSAYHWDVKVDAGDGTQPYSQTWFTKTGGDKTAGFFADEGLAPGKHPADWNKPSQPSAPAPRSHPVHDFLQHENLTPGSSSGSDSSSSASPAPKSHPFHDFLEHENLVLPPKGSAVLPEPAPGHHHVSEEEIAEMHDRMNRWRAQTGEGLTLHGQQHTAESRYHDGTCAVCKGRIEKKDGKWVHVSPADDDDRHQTVWDHKAQPKTSPQHGEAGWESWMSASLHTAETNPPYYVEEKDGKYVVVNDEGEVKGTFDTKEQARAQQSALYANVPGAAEKAKADHGDPKPKVKSSKTAASKYDDYDAAYDLGKKHQDAGRPYSLPPLLDLPGVQGYKDGYEGKPKSQKTAFDSFRDFADFLDVHHGIGEPEDYYGPNRHPKMKKDEHEHTSSLRGPATASLMVTSGASEDDALADGHWRGKADAKDGKPRVAPEHPRDPDLTEPYQAGYHQGYSEVMATNPDAPECDVCWDGTLLCPGDDHPFGACGYPTQCPACGRHIGQGKTITTDAAASTKAEDDGSGHCKHCGVPVRQKGDGPRVGHATEENEYPDLPDSCSGAKYFLEQEGYHTGSAVLALLAEGASEDDWLEVEAGFFHHDQPTGTSDRDDAARQRLDAEDLQEDEGERAVMKRHQDYYAQHPTETKPGHWSSRHEAVNEDAEGAARYQNTPDPAKPDWVTEWSDPETRATEEMIEEGRVRHIPDNPFAETLTTVRQAALRTYLAGQHTAADFENLDGLDQAPDVGSQFPTTPTTTRPRVMPEEAVGNNAEKDYTQPTTEQMVAARIARLAARVQVDNPDMDPDTARAIAAQTVATYPEMVTVAGESRGASGTCPVCYRSNLTLVNDKIPTHKDTTREGSPRCEGSGKDA